MDGIETRRKVEWNMTVSILMPTYNDEAYIDNSLDSLLNQGYKNWELIVIDGSSDHTPEIVRRFADKDKRIKYHREQSSGQLNALMYGAQFAKGEFVTLFHSDDELSDNEAIGRNVLTLTENNLDGIFCDLIIIDQNGECSGLVKTARNIDFSSLAVLFLRGGSNIIPDFFFVRKEAFRNVFSSYITWGVQYWLKLEENLIGTLNLKKVVPWYKYRKYPGNYAYSEVGKFELATGGLRSILEIGKRIDLPFLKLQRFLVRILKTGMKPLFNRSPSSAKNLQEMVEYVIKSRYESIPENLYYNGVLGFYSNFPSDRTIRLDFEEEDKIFLGNDTHVFFSLMEKKKLPSIYEDALTEAAHGFGKVAVKNIKDLEKARSMMRFLNLLTKVEIG